MLLRRSWPLFVAGLFVALSFALSALASTPETLFVIQRSKNADEAHYDARVNTDGALDPGGPVDGYFLNKNANGSWTRADFTVFQKIAYGWSTESTGKGTYALKLRAFKERPMWVVKANGKWRVQTTIAGKSAYMTKLYVATDESGIMPRVLYVDVFGEDAASGSALTEHMARN